MFGALQFAPEPPPTPDAPGVPDVGRPGPTPVPMCFLPSDAELNSRADFRNYFSALTGTMTITAAAAVEMPCFYQPGV